MRSFHRFRPFAAAFAASVLASCTCGTDRDPGPRRAPTEGPRGAEAHPAVAYPSEEPAPAREAFVPVSGPEALAALGSARRAGSWAGLRRGGPERRSAGNFVCRLETAFGAPTSVRDDRVVWVLREAESGLVLTAVADATEPWIGAVLGPDASPEAQTDAAQIALALARRIDATEPAPCRYVIASSAVGVADGEYF